MRFIFSKCEYVFSWLGETDDSSDGAMDSIARLATCEKQKSAPFYAISTKQGCPFFEAAPWIEIRKLLEREFWYRVWIFQEMMLPKKLVLACGSKSIPRTTFEALNDLRVDILYRRSDHKLLRRELTHLDLGTLDEVIAVYRIAQSFVWILAFRSDCDRPSTIIRYTTHLKATDARDKMRKNPEHTFPNLTLENKKCIVNISEARNRWTVYKFLVSAELDNADLGS